MDASAGTYIRTKVSSIEELKVCSILVSRFDTVSKKSFVFKESLLDIYPEIPNNGVGKGCQPFVNNQCIVSFIPRVKGFFYISTDAADSPFTINGVRGVLGVGIKAPDKRLRTIAKWSAICFPQNTEQEYYDNMLAKEAQGAGYYGFFVE
jgi:hypothetical protein